MIKVLKKLHQVALLKPLVVERCISECKSVHLLAQIGRVSRVRHVSKSKPWVLAGTRVQNAIQSLLSCPNFPL